MFLYDNRLLKAELTNGILETQTLMVDLYSINLNSVAIQAALLCSVTYLGINTIYAIPGQNYGSVICLMSQACYSISISCSLIMMSHCVLASMLGPTKSLVGESSDAVQICVKDMYREQELGVIMLFSSISLIFIGDWYLFSSLFFITLELFVGTAIQMYDNYPFGFALTLTIIYILAMVVFIWTGSHTYKIFQLDHGIKAEQFKKDQGYLFIWTFRNAFLLNPLTSPKPFFQLTDLEADLGFDEREIDNMTHSKGYNILGNDILMLQEQVTYGYKRTNRFWDTSEGKKKLGDETKIKLSESSHLLDNV